MLKMEIERLRNKLDNMIIMDAAYEKIYEASVQLDRLIVEYYTLNYRKHFHK